MRIFHRILILFTAAATIHCGGCATSHPPSADGGVDAGPTTGSLVILINGPSGSSANVSIAGPNGYSKNLTQTTTLSVLPGSYSVTASNTSQPTGLTGIEDVATVSGSPANVQLGAAAVVTVAYQALPGTGMLWVPNNGSAQWQGFDSAAIAFGGVSGFSVPRVTLQFDGGQGPEALAFDPAGNLWGVDYNGTVMSVSANQLGVDAVLAPTLVIFPTTFDAGLGVLASSIDLPVSLAFDHLGNLWIGNTGGPTGGSLVEYGPNQLTGAGGALIPINTFTSPFFGQVYGIAFDNAGDLWLSTTGPIPGVLKFSLATLLDGGATPEIFITDDGGLSPLALTRPENFAFDKNGDIWVTNCDIGSQAYFVAHYQASSGWSAQDTLVTAYDGGIAECPTALAFDSQSNLWVSADNTPPTLLVYTPDQLTRGLFVDGGPVAANAFSVPGAFDWCGIALNPSPQGLPLAH